MALILHYHPLASFCHKALIALYEHGLDFEPVIVNLGDPESRAEFARVWPLLKFPVLRDDGRGATVAESTVIIEYLDAFHAGVRRLIPADPEHAWRVRLWDRIFDQYLELPMQKIVTDALRAPGENDPAGVAEARTAVRTSYRFLEEHLALDPWASGADFTLADCAAAPALSYCDTVEPFGAGEPRLAAYLDRLASRPSVARVLREAEPYFGMFPLLAKPRLPKGAA
jgi:glutathione S-transferase